MAHLSCSQHHLFVQLLRFAETGNAPPSLPNPLNIFEKLNQSVGAATEKPFVLLVFFVSVLVTFPTKEFASVIEFTVAGVVSLPFNLLQVAPTPETAPIVQNTPLTFKIPFMIEFEVVPVSVN